MSLLRSLICGLAASRSFLTVGSIDGLWVLSWSLGSIGIDGDRAEDECYKPKFQTLLDGLVHHPVFVVIVEEIIWSWTMLSVCA